MITAKRQFGLGDWETICGTTARIRRLRSLGPNNWSLDGAVEDPVIPSVWIVNSWYLDGISCAFEGFNLVKEVTKWTKIKKT